METLLRIGLSNAVAALLLALVVVTVACLWRRPAVLHALWLLVLVKLVTPPLVWLPDPWTEAEPPPPAPAVDSSAPAPESVDPAAGLASADAPAAPDLALVVMPAPEAPEAAPA